MKIARTGKRIALAALTAILLVLLAGCGVPEDVSDRILYLAPGEGDPPADQLFLLTLDGSRPDQLTNAPLGVFDYAPRPDGGLVAYSAHRTDGGTDFWMIGTDGRGPQLLIECPGAGPASSYLPLGCSEPAWSPDGSRLIYTLRGDARSPRLWWMELKSTGGGGVERVGEPVPVFDDPDLAGQMANWSPDGTWLSYVAPDQGGVIVTRLADGRNWLVPSQMEAPAVWRPDSKALLVTDIYPEGERVSARLVLADLEAERWSTWTQQEGIDDGSPAWSPDGEWLVLGRKVSRVPTGRQLWLARADGSELRPLLEELDTHHALPSWSPDGLHVLFQRTPARGDDRLPGIWVIEIASGDLQEVASPGYWPAWLP